MFTVTVFIRAPNLENFKWSFLPPIWCLSLSPLYFNRTLLHKSSEWSSLISGPGLNSSPLEAKNPGVFAWFGNNLSSWGLVWFLQDKMGANNSSLTPLNCILKNWGRFDPPGLKKTYLVFLCDTARPQYPLEDGIGGQLEGLLSIILFYN